MLNCDSAIDKIQLERKLTDIKDFGRFKINEKKITNQYTNIYNKRLNILGERLREKVKQKWGNYRILKLKSLSESIDDVVPVVVIGTLYKHQELKPSILKGFADELQLASQPSRFNYNAAKEQIFLEDEVLRIKLIGEKLNPKEVVTGIVCAVLGRQLSSDGDFSVEDILFPGISPKASSSKLSMTHQERILFVSALDVANTPDCLALELLTEWITGMAGNSRAQQEEASIGLVIIAGNSVKGSGEFYSSSGYSGKKNQYKTVALEATTVASYRFDKLLKQIVENSRVLLMPGQFDPSNHSIPQQALHPCILPESSKFRSFYGGTNPWIGKIGDRIVAGSSGQPVEDIMMVADLMNFSPLDWLEKTLTWCHIAPTAPDTLPAYPYFDSDPFVIEVCPDIYFVGNMEDYSTRLVIGEEGQAVRLISIPKFSKTQTAVIVDLNSLETWPITFGMDKNL